MSTSETRCPDDTGFNDMSLHPRESFFVSAVCLQILQVRVLIIELIWWHDEKMLIERSLCAEMAVLLSLAQNPVLNYSQWLQFCVEGF